MKVLSRKGLVIGAFLLLAVTQILAASRPRRQISIGVKESALRKPRSAERSNDEGSTTALSTERNENTLSPLGAILVNLPFGIGNLMNSMFNYIGKEYNMLDQLTNGALSQVLNNCLPCEINLSGWTCNDKNGGMSGAMETLIRGLSMPNAVKNMMLLFVEGVIIPFVDKLLGQ